MCIFHNSAATCLASHTTWGLCCWKNNATGSSPAIYSEHNHVKILLSFQKFKRNQMACAWIWVSYFFYINFYGRIFFLWDESYEFWKHNHRGRVPFSWKKVSSYCLRKSGSSHRFRTDCILGELGLARPLDSGKLGGEGSEELQWRMRNCTVAGERRRARLLGLCAASRRGFCA